MFYTRSQRAGVKFCSVFPNSSLNFSNGLLLTRIEPTILQVKEKRYRRAYRFYASLLSLYEGTSIYVINIHRKDNVYYAAETFDNRFRL